MNVKATFILLLTLLIVLGPRLTGRLRLLSMLVVLYPEEVVWPLRPMTPMFVVVVVMEFTADRPMAVKLLLLALMTLAALLDMPSGMVREITVPVVLYILLVASFSRLRTVSVVFMVVGLVPFRTRLLMNYLDLLVSRRLFLISPARTDPYATLVTTFLPVPCYVARHAPAVLPQRSAALLFATPYTVKYYWSLLVGVIHPLGLDSALITRVGNVVGTVVTLSWEL